MVQEKTKQKKKQKKINDVAKYTGIAFQMVVIILLGVFGGIKLDEKVTGIEFPLFTIIFSLLAIGLALYYTIKDLLKMNKPDDK